MIIATIQNPQRDLLEIRQFTYMHTAISWALSHGYLPPLDHETIDNPHFYTNLDTGNSLVLLRPQFTVPDYEADI